MANLTLSVDDDIIRAAKIYAAANGTSISQLVRKHLAEITGVSPVETSDREAVLRGFSLGRMGRKEAMEVLGVDYGTLLLLLSEHRLSLPRVSDEDAKVMAGKFVQVWKASE